MPLIAPGLDSIDSVPIHLLVGSDDTHCSLDHAYRIASEIGDAVKSVDVVDGFSHGSFGSATNIEYVNMVLAALEADDTVSKEV